MPTIYLSPSLQEFNPYVDGGNEEYYMNLIADAMEPYLNSSGIQFTRNEPSQTLSQAIAQSNAGNYDLHLALHSNAAPPALAGQIRGADVYYYNGSQKGQRAAEIIANNFKAVYPDPSKVKTVPTTTLAELKRTKAPSVLIEVAYHDNSADAQWIRDNIDNIARNLVLSLTEYFGIPFVPPGSQPQRQGPVTTQQTPLNIRSQPSLNAPVIGQAPKGATVTILGENGGWYEIQYQNITGYASKEYIR